MASPSEDTRKALGVGIFYVLGGLLAIVGWPTIVPSVLLGSGVALMVYHFLGGVDSGDKMNLSLSQKAAIQVGGASVILLTFSAGIWYGLTEWRKDNVSSDPDFEDVLILGKDGEPVEALKIKRGNELMASLAWPKRASPRSLAGNELTLAMDSRRKRIMVAPLLPESASGGAAKGFSYGHIQADTASSSLVALISELQLNDFFNPAIVAVRAAICSGAACPISLAGFPITLASAERAGLDPSLVAPGKIWVCYNQNNIAVPDVLKPSSVAANPSFVIQALQIYPSPEDVNRSTPRLLIDRVDKIEANAYCQRLKGKTDVVAVVHANDLKRITNGFASFPQPSSAAESRNPVLFAMSAR